jgi:hypothetical protein
MKIKIPENYSLPEEVVDGDTFEELVTFRVDGGSLVPMMIAGVEVATGEEETEAEVDEMAAEDVAMDEVEVAAPMTGMGERIMGMA